MFHNRLTHSLQVAQVGRRLAEKLLLSPTLKSATDFVGIDPDTVEAACLAHDLGHPPFGHAVEEELDRLAGTVGGYEGNAQSFRILTQLSFRSPAYRGLDLTRATLAAVLKYPWMKDANPVKPHKWGAYNLESDDFDFARELYPYALEQTPEAYIMDWADDITYSVHDLEDFYQAGRIPLHLLAQDKSSEQEYFFNDVFERMPKRGNSRIADRREELQEAFRELLLAYFSTTEQYRGTGRQRAGLKNFTSNLISRYINGVSVVEKEGRVQLEVDPNYRDEVMMLKELIWTYVIQDPALASQQLGQKHMIRQLFDVYTHAAEKREHWKLFPAFYRERLEEAHSDSERIRTCIDLISGFTENQVHRIHNRLTGSASESSLNDPLR